MCVLTLNTLLQRITSLSPTHKKLLNIARATITGWLKSNLHFPLILLALLVL